MALDWGLGGPWAAGSGRGIWFRVWVADLVVRRGMNWSRDRIRSDFVSGWDLQIFSICLSDSSTFSK
jgi:hypothetical protein